MKRVSKKVLNAVLLIILVAAFFPVLGQARHLPGGGGGGSPPSTPVLNSITSPTNNVYLSWNSVYAGISTSYLIYRNYSYVTTTTDCYYTDYPPDRGEWLYYVVAHTAYGDSGDSNTESVFFIDGVKKIAIFFWDSNAIKSNYIYGDSLFLGYDDILSNEGYTEFFYYPNTDNYEGDFDTVNEFEFAGDIVFFYLAGHGMYNGVDSYTELADGSSRVYSSDFRTLMDGLDSTVKGILVESCYSGGWVDDFNAPEYLAISSSNNTHQSQAAYSLPSEGLFSRYFFEGIDSEGYDAEYSYNYAWNRNIYYSTHDRNMPDSTWSLQYPQFSNNVEHNFFAD